MGALRQAERTAAGDTVGEQPFEALAAEPVGAVAVAHGGGDLCARIAGLAGLRDEGILSDAEFTQTKAKLIGAP